MITIIHVVVNLFCQLKMKCKIQQGILHVCVWHYANDLNLNY